MIGTCTDFSSWNICQCFRSGLGCTTRSPSPAWLSSSLHCGMPGWEGDGESDSSMARRRKETCLRQSLRVSRQWMDLQRYIKEYWLQSVGPNVVSVAFAPRHTNNCQHPPIFSIANVVSNELDNTSAPWITATRFKRILAICLLHKKQNSRGSNVRSGDQLHPFDFLCKATKRYKKYLLHQAMQNHAQRVGAEEEEGKGALRRNSIWLLICFRTKCFRSQTFYLHFRADTKTCFVQFCIMFPSDCRFVRANPTST